MLVQGHNRPGDERVIDDRGAYVVVEKLGAGALAALRLDPRRMSS
jgi:hypothetical protein